MQHGLQWTLCPLPLHAGRADAVPCPVVTALVELATNTAASGLFFGPAQQKPQRAVVMLPCSDSEASLSHSVSGESEGAVVSLLQHGEGTPVMIRSNARGPGGSKGRVFVASDVRNDPVDVKLLVAALVLIAQDLAVEREQARIAEVGGPSSPDAESDPSAR